MKANLDLVFSVQLVAKTLGHLQAPYGWSTLGETTLLKSPLSFHAIDFGEIALVSPRCNRANVHFSYRAFLGTSGMRMLIMDFARMAFNAFPIRPLITYSRF